MGNTWVQCAAIHRFLQFLIVQAVDLMDRCVRGRQVFLDRLQSVIKTDLQEFGPDFLTLTPAVPKILELRFRKRLLRSADGPADLENTVNGIH